MKTLLKNLIVLFALALATVSCSSDDDSAPNIPIPASRNIKYEITGNFSGDHFDTTFTPATGGAVNEDVNSLPWIKEITVNQNVSGVGMNAGGSGGVAGETITLKIYAGGVVVQELTAAANGDGLIVAAMQGYVFPQ